METAQQLALERLQRKLRNLSMDRFAAPLQTIAQPPVTWWARREVDTLSTPSHKAEYDLQVLDAIWSICGQRDRAKRIVEYKHPEGLRAARDGGGN